MQTYLGEQKQYNHRTKRIDDMAVLISLQSERAITVKLNATSIDWKRGTVAIEN